jgi:hypothetical protein
VVVRSSSTFTFVTAAPGVDEEDDASVAVKFVTRNPRGTTVAPLEAEPEPGKACVGDVGSIEINEVGVAVVPAAAVVAELDVADSKQRGSRASQRSEGALRRWRARVEALTVQLLKQRGEPINPKGRHPRSGRGHAWIATILSQSGHPGRQKMHGWMMAIRFGRMQ